MGKDEESNVVRLVSVAEAARHQSRSAKALYDEIQGGDYREEQGVFFRHLNRREWRISEFQFLYWRRIPLSAAADARLKEASDFLLLHIEPAVTALLMLRRQLHEARDNAAERIEAEQKETAEASTNHSRGGGGGMRATMNTTPPNSFDPSHELLTVPAFAKRISRSKVSVYKDIRQHKFPVGTVVYLHGGAMRMDWTLYAKSLRIRA